MRVRVDVVDLEVRDLGHAQARAIGDTERGLVLDAWRRFEQPRRFLHAQHLGQLARIPGDHQRARQIPPLQRHREQEAQRRDRAVDRRRADAVLMLVQLEAPDVLGRRGVGSAPKERGKAPDMTNVVLLRMRSQAPHQHVLLHALAKRRDRSIGRQGSHGKFLSLKGTPWSDRGLYPLKAYEYRAISEPGDPPAKRVRA